LKGQNSWRDYTSGCRMFKEHSRTILAADEVLPTKCHPILARVVVVRATILGNRWDV
jgi:hypothetical protein